MGSVFDYNSLGKWIYDWTVWGFGGGHPISDLAGDFWMSLIELFGNIKSAEEKISKLKSTENREMEDLIKCGKRSTEKLRELLKSCEISMLKSGRIPDNRLGVEAGVGFLNTFWGRDRTEKCMTAIRLSNFRFKDYAETLGERNDRR